MARERKWLWLFVTDDKYEFPIYIAETSRELARICGIGEKSVSNAVLQAEKTGCNSRYKRVAI